MGLEGERGIRPSPAKRNFDSILLRSSGDNAELLRAGQMSECNAAGGLTPPYPFVIG